MKCKSCNLDHNGKFGSGIFCSRSCSNKRENIDYGKVSKALRKYPEIEKRNCKICGLVFLPKRRETQTCSKSCSMKMRYGNPAARVNTSNSVKGKTGGWRNFGGNGKKGIYNGFVFQSSWEEIWIKFHLRNGIQFRRCTEFFLYMYEGKQHKYYPDFFLPETNTYVEVKGFWSKRTEAKINSIPKDFNVQVILKEDIAGMV